MWQCPACGRSFARTEQAHFCKDGPQTVDYYISVQPEAYHTRLESVRQTIRQAAPEAVEKISWQMPTYFWKENLIHFAFNKDHLGLYPGPEAVEAFAPRLTEEGYKFSKGAIRLPWQKGLPLALIAEITRYRVTQVAAKD